ncbi:MAG TPA: hypothetical protein ENH85_08910 [Candidatus Scalindua sp.]|nr:hypothetical protein [Candidatus Scalindua sp.]
MNIIKGIKKGMKYFGVVVSSIINSVLLLFIYLFGVGLTALIAKISGKNFLEIKILNRSSYWSNLDLTKKPIKEYYNQF